jgi:hypothetical protein
VIEKRREQKRKEKPRRHRSAFTMVVKAKGRALTLGQVFFSLFGKKVKGESRFSPVSIQLGLRLPAQLSSLSLTLTAIGLVCTYVLTYKLIS